jgi:hypothetical protein
MRTICLLSTVIFRRLCGRARENLETLGKAEFASKCEYKNSKKRIRIANQYFVSLSNLLRLSFRFFTKKSLLKSKMTVALTQGAAAAMFNNIEVKQPVLQIINIRSVAGGNVTRYRYVFHIWRKAKKKPKNLFFFFFFFFFRLMVAHLESRTAWCFPTA